MSASKRVGSNGDSSSAKRRTKQKAVGESSSQPNHAKPHSSQNRVSFVLRILESVTPRPSPFTPPPSDEHCYGPTSEIDENVESHQSLRLREWMVTHETEVVGIASKKLKETELQLQAKAMQYSDLSNLNQKYKSKADGLLKQVEYYQALARYLRDCKKYAQTDYESSSDNAVDKPEQQQPLAGIECKVCKKQTAVVMMCPCRHICVCLSCDAVAEKCPLCETMKTKSVEVCLPLSNLM